MTSNVLTNGETSKDEDEAEMVERAVDRLLADFESDPATPHELWGRQFDAGLAWVDFPVGHGGLGVSRNLRRRVDAMLTEAGYPDSTAHNGIGIGLVGPVLVSHGSEAQRKRYLRPLFTCQELWCQLFSEPGAGSDLASLATRAEPAPGDDAAGWIVNGQKVWTTLGHVAPFGLLVARTDLDVPKHAGLSMFVVDMSSPGIEVRGIREITGGADFNEVFMHDVAVPAEALIGATGSGWSAVVATLANERAGFSEKPFARGGGPIAQAIALWAEHGAECPELTDRYLRTWVRAEAVRLAEVAAHQVQGDGGAAAAWSYIKIARSELDQEIYDFCVSLLGSQGLEYPSYEMHRPTTMEDVTGVGSDVRRAYLFSRCATIAGGTSEVQRGIVADRVLRLPREPQSDKGVSWRQLRRG